ncbi:MAG: hypothetical protein ACK50J_27350, partial [Planctomyces sp.]
MLVAFPTCHRPARDMFGKRPTEAHVTVSGGGGMMTSRTGTDGVFTRGRRALLVALCLSSFRVQPASAGSQLEELAIQAGYRILSPGDSSAVAQRRATDSLPLNRMIGPNRNRAMSYLRQCNQFRHLPDLQYSADPSIYRYLIQHPDVAVSTWRVMGISKFEMWQTGPEKYEARAVDGSEGIMDVLYRDQQQCIFVCQGSYHNPLLPKSLDAGALVWIRWKFLPMSDGTFHVTQKADAFIVFESQGLSTFAKVLTPITNSLMDRNLFEVSLYVGMMSRAVREEPEWVIDVARQMDGVMPQRSNELIAIARQNRPTSRAEALRGRGASRNAILNSGISIFEPPSPESLTSPQSTTLTEGLAAAPGKTAPPVPPVPRTAGTVPAASSSVVPTRTVSASSEAVPVPISAEKDVTESPAAESSGDVTDASSDELND